MVGGAGTCDVTHPVDPGPAHEPCQVRLWPTLTPRPIRSWACTLADTLVPRECSWTSTIKPSRFRSSCSRADGSRLMA